MLNEHVRTWCRRFAAVVVLTAVSGCQDVSPTPAGNHSESAETNASAPDLIRDDVAYLTQLLLTKGHLRVGVELYRQGAFDLADVHMKHPHDELYVDLGPALTARSLPGFADELTALAMSVETRQPVAQVEAAHATVVEAIERAAAIDGAADPGLVIRVVGSLMQTAAEEYAAGVDGTRVVEPKEYQDAWGFTQVAIEQLDKLSNGGGPASEVAAEIRTRIDALAPAWPSVVPPATLTTPPASQALSTLADYIEEVGAKP